MKDPIVVEGFENVIKECSGFLPKSLISKINEKKISSAIFFPMYFKDEWIGIFILFTPPRVKKNSEF